MTTYTVDYQVIIEGQISIDANSEDEAIQIVRYDMELGELESPMNVTDVDVDVTNIEEEEDF